MIMPRFLPIPSALGLADYDNNVVPAASSGEEEEGPGQGKLLFALRDKLNELKWKIAVLFK